MRSPSYSRMGVACSGVFTEAATIDILCAARRSYEVSSSCSRVLFQGHQHPRAGNGQARGPLAPDPPP